MISALIVIYEKKINDSSTYLFLQENARDINIVVFDNSENSDIIRFNKDFLNKRNIMYFSLGKNIGLSKAYNYVIKKMVFKKNDYIMLLDDDSILNMEYINEAKKVINEQYDVILPIVKTNKIIMSPSNIQFNCRVKRIKRIEDLNIKKITAINSGMLINNNVYKIICYNEDLFLDYVDHDFMKKVRKNNFSIYIMNSVIYQDYSRENNGFSKIRYKIFKKDFFKYCCSNYNILFYVVSILKYKIKK